MYIVTNYNAVACSVVTERHNAQCTMHNVRYKLHFNAVACLVVTERQVAEGEQQTEILSVNGKPSEYRSLNILSAMSAFVNIFFLFQYMFFDYVILK